MVCKDLPPMSDMNHKENNNSTYANNSGPSFRKVNINTMFVLKADIGIIHRGVQQIRDTYTPYLVVRATVSA